MEHMTASSRLAARSSGGSKTNRSSTASKTPAKSNGKVDTKEQNENVESGDGGTDSVSGKNTAASSDQRTEASASRPVKVGTKSGSSLEVGEMDVSKAKRQKISESGTLSNPRQQLSRAQPPKNQGSIASNGAVGSSATTKAGKFASTEVSGVQYATDSATAMKNIQHWSSAGDGNGTSFTQPNTSAGGNGSSGDVNTDADVPVSSSSSQQNQDPSATIKQYAQLTPDDIILGHVTAEEIITRYRLSSQRVASTSKMPEEMSSSAATTTASTTSTTDTQVENAQSIFSSGNFNNQVPLSSVTSTLKNTPPTDSTPSCDSHVPTNSLPKNPTNRSEGNVHKPTTSQGPNTTCGAPSSSEAYDSTMFPNMDLRRLIPHLEALADLLQNPTSLEAQYLAALAAKSQMFPSFVAGSGPGGPNSTLPPFNNLEALAAIAAHVGHLESGSTGKGLPLSVEALSALASQNLSEEKHVPPLTSLDISNLFSNADLTKILPTLAALEMQGGMGYRHESSNLKPVPITDPSAIKRVWDEMLFVESNPGYMGGASMGEVGGALGDGVSADYADERAQHQAQMEGSGPPGGTRLPKRSHSLGNNSFLLDGNFEIDIPPPGDLISGKNERNQVSIKIKLFCM